MLFQFITSEEVEHAFWKMVVNVESEVAVKYGADLVASEVKLLIYDF